MGLKLFGTFKLRKLILSHEMISKTNTIQCENPGYYYNKLYFTNK